MSDVDHKTTSLTAEVAKWFEKEGYPLEFRTAQIFQQHGFNTFQGYYCRGETQDLLEIDVLANVDLARGRSEERLFRISYVVECKWSKDKPWVVFTSPGSSPLESACIAQTIGSRLGDAVAFCLAGETSLYGLDTFVKRKKGGFGGRRAFERNDATREDLFFRAVQSVVNKAVMQARNFDLNDPSPRPVPSQGVLVFPLVVVDAELFEASYDHDKDQFELVQTDSSRLYWRGSRAHRRWIASVDVVKVTALESFVHSRRADCEEILVKSEEVLTSIEVGFKTRDFSAVNIKSAPRGYIGLPPVLADLYHLANSKRRAKRRQSRH